MGADESYLAWSLHDGFGLSDVLVAELADVGFEAFEEGDSGLRAFMPERMATREAMSAMAQILARLDVQAVGPERIEASNWNRVWEATIAPVAAGPFVVYPPWCEPPHDALAIRIEPKMSFGTGHHESTRLMLSALPDLIRPGDRVLDAGTGTGVLAIASVKLGATRVVGFDIDPWSARNARENVDLNGLADRIDLLEGDLDAVPREPVDVVLANINRNVLLDLLPSFAERLVPGGRLGLSGILVGDRSVMNAALGAAGFRPVTERTEGEWLSLAAERL